MSIPLVSVLVPTYQHARYIGQCLDGILAQRTTFPFEVLVGEDDSTDGTRQVCQRYAAEHPEHIKLFLRSRKDVMYITGKPTGRANQIGLLSAAKGRYIAYCDGDDRWTDPLKLQKQVDFLEANPDHSITYHDACVIDPHGKVIMATKIREGQARDYTAQELILNQTDVQTLTMVFRNIPEITQEIPHEYCRILNADNFLTSRLGLFGKGKYMDDIKAAEYRWHSGSIWRGLSDHKQRLAKVNSWMWMAAYYDRIGRADVAEHFIDRVNQRVAPMAEWYQLRDRKAYRWFARTMRWFRISLPR